MSSPVVKRAAIFFTGDSNIDPDGVAKKKKKNKKKKKTKNTFRLGWAAPYQIYSQKTLRQW